LAIFVTDITFLSTIVTFLPTIGYVADFDQVGIRVKPVKNRKNTNSFNDLTGTGIKTRFFLKNPQCGPEIA
jgi:hypothetical protein